jgi:hypothetical protein
MSTSWHGCCHIGNRERFGGARLDSAKFTYHKVSLSSLDRSVHILVVAQLLAHCNRLCAILELGKVLGPFGPLLRFYHEIDELFTYRME